MGTVPGATYALNARVDGTATGMAIGDHRRQHMPQDIGDAHRPCVSHRSRHGALAQKRAGGEDHSIQKKICFTLQL